MSIIGSNILAGASGQATGYNLNNSLRFRSSNSAYLTRTPGSASNRKTFTWSAWVKRGLLTSSVKVLFFADTGSSPLGGLYFTASDTIQWYDWVSPTDYGYATTAVYRDPSAWYHVVLAVDTTQATASNRIKLYVNGVQQTFNQNYGDMPQNYDTAINSTNPHYIGRETGLVGTTFDGYMTEINFIDGQALTPSSFGETSTTTGSWIPKKYTSTYGTNGFYLKFSDIATTSGSNAGLGKDFSGNGNYYNTNNISVTAGTTYDAMIDSPTLTSATVANYCVLSPLAGDVAPTNGNLSVSGVDKSTLGTVGVSSGKWYFEMTCVSNVATTNLDGVGIATRAINNAAPDNVGYLYRSSGVKLQYGGANTAYGASFTTGDVIGVAYDADAGTLVFYKNNASQGTAFTGITGTLLPVVYARGITSTPTLALNFGQQPFVYTPPSGFVALNTYNLPDSTIVKGNTVMDATLYTGNGSTQTITNAGAFKPDLVWAKDRTVAANHRLIDSNRGASKILYSSLTLAEATDASGLTSFNSNGFSVGSTQINDNTDTYVAWQWQAGQGTTSSNTSGSITSTVSVNATAGFSVATFTGNGTAGATIGHGLGVAPKMIIVKSRSASGDWWVYHASIGATKVLFLSLTDAELTFAAWNNTAPTSSVFTIGSAGGLNVNSVTQVAYCWAEIAGFSKFGSYTGNASTDGPFVYLGFRPKFIIVKSSSAVGNWFVIDSVRDSSNVATRRLFPNLSNAEDTSALVDFTANGFKLRMSSALNDASTYIYMAFAENPFKNSNAR